MGPQTVPLAGPLLHKPGAMGSAKTSKERSLDKRVTVEAPVPVVRLWGKVLARRLRTRLGSCSLVVTDNTHTMISFTRRRGSWRIRLHHMFLMATDEVLDALAGYVRGDDPAASLILDRFIADRRTYIRRVPQEMRRRRVRVESRGQHHDLELIYSRLNRRFFRNAVDVTITYGPAPRVRAPRKSIKMGSYSPEARVIRIHPALDQPRVPRYFVEWIVFHEMLHHQMRARVRNGRRQVHTPEFAHKERRFPHFARARRWEDENLDLLLRYRGRR